MPIYRGQVPSYTWAAKPSATAYVGHALFTDVGINGSLWFSNGTKWLHESPISILQKTVGWIVPALIGGNAATYSQTGTTVTVTSTGHGIPATVHDGKSVYLAIGSGNATAGWYTNFAYVDANTFTCTSSVSQTTNGTINTNTAETTISDITKTLNGGLLGANGLFIADFSSVFTASANQKTLRLKIGGNTIASANTGASSVTKAATRLAFMNRNDVAKQVEVTTAGAIAGYGSATSSVSTAAVNTASDAEITLTAQVSSQNNYCAIESMIYQVIP